MTKLIHCFPFIKVVSGSLDTEIRYCSIFRKLVEIIKIKGSLNTNQ